MKCQMFSWPLSSGARGGSGASETLGDFGCDLVEMELHGFAVAGRQYEGGTVGADRTEQIGRLGSLIVGSTGA
jgi:hypothetical protein